MISHYRIISKLGEGGMGEVYLAEDTALRRKVAVKVLPPKVVADERARRRLIREARTAATLDHPNICAIYEVSHDENQIFIVMQYVDGETLAARIRRKSLKLQESLAIAVEIVDALVEAHSHGIIHRDIKPQNIMITAQGRAKLMDFGLAKVVEPRPMSESETETLGLTEPGFVVGTIPYMSPEQVRGSDLDGRSDIFSFGAVLYEMVSGVRPFAGASGADTISAILTSKPSPLARYAPEAPAELQQIVSKALTKEKEKRYQAAKDLLLDLKNLIGELEFKAKLKLSRNEDSSVGTRILGPVYSSADQSGVASSKVRRRPSQSPRRGSRKAIDSLAVLPLVSASADPNAEYLSDGITESIINILSQLPRLRVMARSTVFRYKGREVNPQKVGRELAVRAVLTGRVLQLLDSLIISTELVNVADGTQIWGEQYNRKPSDIFAVQEEISRTISERLRIKLTGDDSKKLGKRYTENAEAYQLYLKGLYQMNKGTVEGALKGIECYNKAIELDPTYALAYSGLANSYVWLSHLNLHPREGFPRAKAAATKALQIDETVVEAHLMLGLVKMYYDHDWSGAESEFKRALDLNPNHETAHRLYAFYLTVTRRFDEAIAELKRALDLDPLSLLAYAEMGWSFYASRRYDEAIEQFRKALEMEPNFYMACWGLGSAHTQKGEFPKAIAEFQKAMAFTQGRAPAIIAALAYAYALSGQRDEAQKLLDQLMEASKQRYVTPFYMAQIYAGLGEKDRALEYLEKAYEDRFGWLILIGIHQVWDSLREEPRFQELIRRLGFEP